MPMAKMQLYAEILRQLGEIPNDYDEDMVVEEEVLPEEVVLAENPEYESLTKGEKKER